MLEGTGESSVDDHVQLIGCSIGAAALNLVAISTEAKEVNNTVLANTGSAGDKGKPDDEVDSPSDHTKVIGGIISAEAIQQATKVMLAQHIQHHNVEGSQAIT